MYHYVVNCRYKAVLKQLFSIFLIFSLYFNAFSSARAAGLGGWTLGGGVSQGASVIYNGAKDVILNGAKKVANGTAKITPPPASVAKALAGGAGAIALDLAIKELLGGVDYVLDPANNRITYTKPAEPTDPNDPTVQRIWQLGANEGGGYIYASKEQAGRAMCAKKGGTYSKIDYVSSAGDTAVVKCIIDQYGNYRRWDLMSIANPAYNPNAETDNKPKHLPLETVAQQVISNAAVGNAAAQQAVKAAADTMVAEAETDSTKARPIIQQLEATQSIPTDQTAKGEAVPKESDATGNPANTNTKGTDLTLNFPVFCNWAPSVCQAANVVIQKPQEWAQDIKAAYDDAVDYFKNDEKPEEDNDPPEIKELEPPTLNTSTFKATAGCPQPIPVNITIGTKGTAEISYEPICQFAEKWSFVAPLIGFLSGAMIIIGVGRKGEDSEI